MYFARIHPLALGVRASRTAVGFDRDRSQFWRNYRFFRCCYLTAPSPGRLTAHLGCAPSRWGGSRYRCRQAADALWRSPRNSACAGMRPLRATFDRLHHRLLRAAVEPDVIGQVRRAQRRVALALGAVAATHSCWNFSLPASAAVGSTRFPGERQHILGADVEHALGPPSATPQPGITPVRPFMIEPRARSPKASRCRAGSDSPTATRIRAVGSRCSE